MMKHRAIIMACSKTKGPDRTQAGRLYTGVLWQEWQRHAPADGMMPSGWSHWVLSAEHGLIPAWKSIDPYDRRLTRGRISELASLVAEQWAAHDAFVRRREHEIDVTCCVVGGELYQDLAIEALLPVAVRIDGVSDDGRGGIGILRQRVSRLAEHVSRQLNHPEEDMGYLP